MYEGTSVVNSNEHVKTLRGQERSQVVLELLVGRTHTATMISKGTVRSTMEDAENKRARERWRERRTHSMQAVKAGCRVCDIPNVWHQRLWAAHCV